MERACEDFRVAEEAAIEKYRHLGMPALWTEVFRDPAFREADKRSKPSCAGCTPLYQTIAQTPAVTMKGIMAKARVTASECLAQEGGIGVEADRYAEAATPHTMALVLVPDILRMNGGQA